MINITAAITTWWEELLAAGWYHPTTIEEWTECLTIALGATCLFVVCRWLIAQTSNYLNQGKLSFHWNLHGKYLVQSLFNLAYLTALGSALLRAPLTIPRLNTIIWILLSLATVLYINSLFSRIIVGLQTESSFRLYFNLIRWPFVLLILGCAAYRATENLTLGSQSYILVIKALILSCILCCAQIFAHRTLTHAKNPVFQEIKWQVFVILTLLTMSPIIWKVLPPEVFALRYILCIFTLCSAIYVLLIKNFDKICTSEDSYLYHIVSAFRWPLFWTLLTSAFPPAIARFNNFDAATESSLITMHLTVPIIGFWYGMNSLFSVSKQKDSQEKYNPFMEMCLENFLEKHPNHPLLKYYKTAFIALVSFISNVIFIFVCYAILQHHFGVHTTLFYAGFYLLLGLKFDNIYGLLEYSTRYASMSFYAMLVQCFKKACKFAIYMCFIYYGIEALPFSYPEGDAAWDNIHHVSVMLCVAYGFWTLTSPANISFIFENIFSSKESISDEENTNQKSGLRKMYPVLISHIVRVIVATGFLILVFREFGYNIDTFAAFISANLVAVGFIIQEPLTNYFNSILLMKDKPLAVGDWVIINDIEGEVKAITYRYTAIRKFTQEYVCIPNNTVMNTPIINLSRMRQRRYETEINLAYSTKPEVIKKIIEDIRNYLLQHKNLVQGSQPRVFLNNFGDFSIKLSVMAYIQLPEDETWLPKYEKWLRIKSDINLEIISIVNNNGAEIAIGV